MKRIKDYILEKLIVNNTIQGVSHESIIKEVKKLLDKNKYDDISDNPEKKENLKRYKLYNAYYIEDMNNSLYNGLYGMTFVITSNEYYKHYILNFNKFSEDINFGFRRKGSYQVYTIIKRGISGWKTIKKKFIRELKLKKYLIVK